MPHPAGHFQVTNFLTGKPYPIITDPSRPVEWSTVNAEKWRVPGASSVQLHQVMPVPAALPMWQSGTIYQAPELSELFKSALCQSATGALSPFARQVEGGYPSLNGWNHLNISKRHLDPITLWSSHSCCSWPMLERSHGLNLWALSDGLRHLAEATGSHATARSGFAAGGLCAYGNRGFTKGFFQQLSAGWCCFSDFEFSSLGPCQNWAKYESLEGFQLYSTWDASLNLSLSHVKPVSSTIFVAVFTCFHHPECQFLPLLSEASRGIARLAQLVSLWTAASAQRLASAHWGAKMARSAPGCDRRNEKSIMEFMI